VYVTRIKTVRLNYRIDWGVPNSSNAKTKQVDMLATAEIADPKLRNMLRENIVI